MEKLINTRLNKLLKVFLKLRALTIPKLLPLLPKWIPYILFFRFLNLINGKSIKWMSNMHSFMGTWIKKSTWNNLLVSSKMTLTSYVALRNIFMALSEPLKLGIPKWTIFFLDNGFSRCHSKHNLYTRRVDDHLIILMLYVDDLFLTSSDPKLINHVKSNLKNKFDIIDLRYLHYFLGLQVFQSKEGISLS